MRQPCPYPDPVRTLLLAAAAAVLALTPHLARAQATAPQATAPQATAPQATAIQASAPQATAPQGPSPTHLREAPPAAGLLDINTATLDQLKRLPGFGLAYARRVVAARPYLAKNQLVTRGVIPLDAYNKAALFIIARHQRK